MTNQDKQYLEELFRDRSESANMLEKPSMRGIKNSVVEKYSDQAHFIYELLQNADDAHATKARFILERSRLIFAHNGTRLFSVSNPATEDSDVQSGTLGDINAITSIANSNKTEASIGKFGVGFKAVFQYTSTPHIYDRNFHFKIERFIVPVPLEADFPGRKADETLFVFPFDSPEKSPDEAFEDIADKLKNLTYPLLFLTCLRDIEFECDDTIGYYGKEIEKSFSFTDTKADLVCLSQRIAENKKNERLWLFSRIESDQREYCVGFFIDENDKLRPVKEPAFCFFPTKENTGLNFIIHAPFLLTDSREGILAGNPYNINLVQLLAHLAADSIVYLKKIGDQVSLRLVDDNIMKIIPYDRDLFAHGDNRAKISFCPFYERIKDKLSSNEILPSTDGYSLSENAYWASVPQLAKLYSNQQLALICENESAHWVFPSIGRDDVQRTNRQLFDYIESIVRTNISEDVILSGRSQSRFFNNALQSIQSLESIKGISAEFIEGQTDQWLHEFYKWISETKHRKTIIRDKPVFLNQDRKAVTAFDKAGQLTIFFPVKDIDGFNVVHPSLLEDTETYMLLQDLGVKQPSLRDQIYNTILPKLQANEEDSNASYFKILFDYYCNHCLNGEDSVLIDMIRKCSFLVYYDCDNQPQRAIPSALYLPLPELRAFFQSKPDTLFVAYNSYLNIVGKERASQLNSFFTTLGVKNEISLLSVVVDYYKSARNDLPYPRSRRDIIWEEYIIDGCKEIIDYVVTYKDKGKSILLWDTLLRIMRNYRCFESLSELLYGTCQYFYQRQQKITFTSSDELYLQQQPWLMDRNGDFLPANSLSVNRLSEVYDISSSEAIGLLSFLKIPERAGSAEVDNDSNLNDSQREKIDLANQLLASGISASDILELVNREKRQRELKLEANDLKANTQLNKDRPADASTTSDYDSEASLDSSLFNEKKDDDPDKQGMDRVIEGILGDVPRDNSSVHQYGELNSTTIKVVRDIVGRAKAIPTSVSEEVDLKEDIDQDEFMPSCVDYSKKIEQAKKKSAAEIDRIACFEELQDRAQRMQRYSFGWFNTLLEMESLNSGEANSQSREVSISFAKVEREPGTKRTLVLKHPNRYIPQFIEDLADIPLVLNMGDRKKTVAIEVANIQSYTLRVKLKNESDIASIDLSTVQVATIEAKSPVFLLEALREEFSALGFEETYDMQSNLCENIEFVFGPPGTGKTTHLARNVLLPLMQKENNCRVLVLTPTNKAADVLARRIMEVMDEDHSYEQWLIRFGATGDEEIEQSPVFHDKTFDIRSLSKSITITTIARFPYDFFMPQGSRLYLNAINWDYIVIDEASMIPIANIVYPLYKKEPKKFIIAGDPFQIEPIASVDLWKNENIYTLVKLESFVEPKTIPHQYKVELLTTQYRSVPDIGSIFSSFAYGGILKHYRASSSQRPLNLDNSIGIKTLNIIKYPVSRYESIYRAKRLQHSSSYQVYSALFTYEYICFLSRMIAKANPNEKFRIGVIAPYRAQADLIDKLLASEKLPKEVDVLVGTIHGFQGDECDIIFSVFNTPPTISNSNEMFLNKRNIINVSISRARDYLFVIMPDDDTENVNNLRLVKRVERLIKGTSVWTERLSPALEEMMFGNDHFLEDNAFSTSHQSVNVYGLPEKRYEVRTEDSAVDIQIHRGLR